LRRYNVSEEKIAALQVGTLDKSLFSEKEQAALALADKMAYSGQAVDDDLWERLTSFFDDGQLVEIVCAIGLFHYFNRVNDALRTEITR
jgi:alkylhydroperoxidase family enzyme